MRSPEVSSSRAIATPHLPVVSIATGTGRILNGTGYGSALSLASGAETDVSDPVFEDPTTGVSAICTTPSAAPPSAGAGADLTRLPGPRVPTASP